MAEAGSNPVVRHRFTDGHNAADPPETMPNSEVKRSDVDGSVGSPHVRVEHRRVLNPNPRGSDTAGVFVTSGRILQKFCKIRPVVKYRI